MANDDIKLQSSTMAIGCNNQPGIDDGLMMLSLSFNVDVHQLQLQKRR